MNLNNMSPENKRLAIIGLIFISSLLVISGDLNETITLIKGC